MEGLDTALSGAGSGAATGAMVGGPWGAAIGGGIGGLIGLFGGRSASKKRKQQQKMLEEQRRQMLEEYGKQDITALENPFAAYASDPSLRETQKATLNRYGQIVNSGGSDPIYANALNEAKLSEQSRLRGEREAIMRDANRRGVNNLGQINSLINAQHSAGREAQRNTAAAGEQYGRLLQALDAQGGLAGRMSDQDFDQAFKKSEARRAWDMYNRNMRNSFYQGKANLIGGNNQAASNLGDMADRQDRTMGEMFNTFGSLAQNFGGLKKQSTPSLETNTPYKFDTQPGLSYSNPNKPKYKIGGY